MQTQWPFTGGKPHTFYIPVMGTGFTIDTPLHVARFGIDSVVSIGDDILIEQMRRVHCERNNLPYEEIPIREEDHRARRITAYLNLLDRLVTKQMQKLRTEPFEPDSDITRYFELLPDCALKLSYKQMLTTSDPDHKARQQDELRRRICPGSIDVNIMTALDRDAYRNGNPLPPEYALAMSGLRGYANSTLRSSIVLSAGINRRLYGYIAHFDDFFPDAQGRIKKKVVLKVSDFRSAAIQGAYLAKRGVWVSEFRVESGLNCGGHAFPTKGLLMGPILEEFCSKRSELVGKMQQECVKAVTAAGRHNVTFPDDVAITVQGGVGVPEEHDFLLTYYHVAGVGWGTPFLLVPEVTNVDSVHVRKLSEAGERDVILSDCSPLGVPFWTLRTSASEEVRRQRIHSGQPGSPCAKGYLGMDTEFSSVPICRASHQYQMMKIRRLSENGLSPTQQILQRNIVLSKSCICCDLAGGALIKNGINGNANPAVCCGPNIVNFSGPISFEKLVSFIYGRDSLPIPEKRPHVFITELRLYVEYLRRDIEKSSMGLIERTTKDLLTFRDNLVNGIAYYRKLAEQFSIKQKAAFLADLDNLAQDLECLFFGVDMAASSGAQA
ncbi:MAG: hypothetical protein JW763_00570 [candidate division Zixibacteria bacterium]|nr:hypothetical protein [candidate division Zixibacteria bacterium]